MTVDEKLDYIGGTPGWFIKLIPRLGIPEKVNGRPSFMAIANGSVGLAVLRHS